MRASAWRRSAASSASSFARWIAPVPPSSPRSAWQSASQAVRLASSEDARYVGLCMPRFLLPLPYGENQIPVKAFNFTEDVVDSHDKYLWAPASLALTTRIADSFAKFRWGPNIIGPQAGRYWSHLTPELGHEAAANHCFHVFGVYPWTRFLGRGMD